MALPSDTLITPQMMIDKRESLWHQSNDIMGDAVYIDYCADWMKKDSESTGIITKMFVDNPELFIETYFIVVDKDGNTTPFKLNKVQRQFIRHLNKARADYNAGVRKHLKFLILKGRQQGFTTVITAYQLAMAVTRRNFRGMTLADTTDNTEAIFSDKAKFVYEALPKRIKPLAKYNTRRELHFQSPSNKGLNSIWRIATAGTKEVGRSKTLHFFHGSEGAFWPDLQGTLTGLKAALTKNCIVIIESTANGLNDYKDLWDDDLNNWDCLFYEWWETPEYQMDFLNDLEEKQFMENVTGSIPMDNANELPWLYARCKWLRDAKALTWKQLNWYFNQWKDYREMIKQEYPCTPEEAFLSSGRPYFDVEKVSERLSEVRASQSVTKPRTGYFEYDYDMDLQTKNKIIKQTSIKWVDHRKGYVTILKEPVERVGYSLGADTASDGEDRNIAQVVSPSGEQMATIDIDKDEDLFADQQYCLGKLYNWALIADEVNHSTHPTKVLVERQYPKLYIRGSSPDTISGRLTQKYGFMTTGANRSTMLGQLRTMMREHPERINDVDTLREMMTFVIADNGKPEAQSGKHDDRIMALAIAYYIRQQQIAETRAPVSELKGEYLECELEDMGYKAYEIKRYYLGDPLPVRRLQ